MLSLEQCKKHLNSSRSDEEILQIRECLYSLADIYLEKYLKGQENEKEQSPDR